MLHLEYLDNKELISLAEALCLDPYEDPDECKVDFALYGYTRDYVMSIKDEEDCYPEVSTFTDFDGITSLDSTIYQDYRDLDSDVYLGTDTAHIIVGLIAGAWERALVIKRSEDQIQEET